MTIEKDLLWKAWPEGLVHARGVRTLGGWQCVKVSVFEQPEYPPLSMWLPPPKLSSTMEKVFVDLPIEIGNHPVAGWCGTPHLFPRILKARENGDLLPAVDTRDSATWASLVSELASVTVTDAKLRPYEVFFGKDYEDASGVWCLWSRGGKIYYFDEIGVRGIGGDRPEKALVRARAWVRKELGR